MSFLDKFKGKTQLLSKQQVGGLLGTPQPQNKQTTPTLNKQTTPVLNKQSITSPKSKTSKHQSKPLI